MTRAAHLPALPTPGAYIKLRRCAAGLAIADVAAKIPTDPATPEHETVLWLELIEADAQPMTLDTVAALGAVFPLDVQVLVRLAAIAQGQDLTPPYLCHQCGWGTIHDPLHWPVLDLCRPCYAVLTPDDVAARVAERTHPAFRSAAA